MSVQESSVSSNLSETPVGEGKNERETIEDRGGRLGKRSSECEELDFGPKIDGRRDRTFRFLTSYLSELAPGTSGILI